MAFDPSNFQPISAFPQRAIYPAYVLEKVSGDVIAGSWLNLGGNANGALMCSTYNLLSWGLGVSGELTVRIRISYDEIVWFDFLPVILYGVKINFINNLFLPGWQVQFRAENPNPAVDITILGFIRLQASR